MSADNVQREIIHLSKPESAIGLGSKRVRVNLGWDPAENEAFPHDLDLSCFLFGPSRRLERAENLIYYGHRFSSTGTVIHSCDDPSGQRSERGPDEWIDVDLTYLARSVQEILFVVSVYDHGPDPVYLGDLHNAFIEVKNDVTHARLYYHRIEGVDLTGAKSLEVGSLIRGRAPGQWEFVVSGCTHPRGLESIIETYSDIAWEFSIAKEPQMIDMNATLVRRSSQA